jgi:hypothetical protein
MYPDVELTDYRKRGLAQMRLTTSFQASIDNMFDICAPIGYEFEVSIPWGFRNTFDPVNPRYRAGGCIHDLLWKTEYFPRWVCDRIFLAALLKLRVSWMQRNIMYVAVRMASKGTWTRHTVNSVRKARNLMGVPETRRPLYGADALPSLKHESP